MVMVFFALMAGVVQDQVMQCGWEVRGGVRADSKREMSWSSQGLDSSGGLPGREFMDTSKHRPRSGLRKASRSVSGGASGLLMCIQSGWRVPSGPTDTSQTGSWTASSRTLNSSLWPEDRVSGLGGCSRSGFSAVLAQMVWSLKDSTGGGGGCSVVVEEVEPSPTKVPRLWQGGASWLTAVSSAGLCSMMGLKDTHPSDHFDFQNKPDQRLPRTENYLKT